MHFSPLYLPENITRTIVLFIQKIFSWFLTSIQYCIFISRLHYLWDEQLFHKLFWESFLIFPINIKKIKNFYNILFLPGFSITDFYFWANHRYAHFGSPWFQILSRNTVDAYVFCHKWNLCYYLFISPSEKLYGVGATWEIYWRLRLHNNGQKKLIWCSAKWIGW